MALLNGTPKGLKYGKMRIEDWDRLRVPGDVGACRSILGTIVYLDIEKEVLGRLNMVRYFNRLPAIKSFKQLRKMLPSLCEAASHEADSRPCEYTPFLSSLAVAVRAAMIIDKEKSWKPGFIDEMVEEINILEDGAYLSKRKIKGKYKYYE